MPAFRALLACIALTVPSFASALAPPATTLTYVNRSSDTGQQMILRRDGAQLVIVDAGSQAILASAAAADTQRVVVRGADGLDDSLTLDLSSPISLPLGIDYDGGAGGWDTLVLTGGAVRAQTLTQINPHDGVYDLDGLALRYVNLEPIIDLVPAATYLFLGTVGADLVTITDGPGAGQTTIDSIGPTFESVTFSNKVAVTYDGNGGADTVTLNNPTPATGHTTLIIKNVASVTQTGAIKYQMFGVSATGAVTLNNAANDVDNLEIVTQTGAIAYTDADDVTIGGVDATLQGLRVGSAGGITVIANGTINLAKTGVVEMVRAGSTSGDVILTALGASSDIAATVNLDAITAPAGSIALTAGRDILLGMSGPDHDNDVRAGGSITFVAGRDIAISGFADVVADDSGAGTGGNASATAGRDFMVTSATGTDGSFGASGAAGADTIVKAESGSVTLSAGAGGPVFSASGDVSISTNRLIITASPGISAPGGAVTIASAGVPVDLGSTTDAAAALELSDAEVDRISTPSLIVASKAGFNLTVTQPITFAGSLTLRSADTITATGTGSLGAPNLVFDDVGATARTWTIDGASVTRSPGAAIPYSGASTLRANGGSGSDTFNVTPSATTAIAIDGNAPTPPTAPGDALAVSLAGTTTPSVSSTASASGYAGSYTFGNRAAVAFSDIESLAAATDLAVSKSDGAATATPGTAIAYTIVVSNLGTLGVSGATVVDTFPAALLNVNWTCTASPGSTCTAGGSGSLNQSVDLAAGGTATFIVTALIDPAATGSLVNSVTVGTPAGVSDSNGANNTAIDDDTLVASADLSIAKTAPPDTYVPGTSVTYTIVVGNAGPSNAAGVTMTDPLPPGTTFGSLSAPGAFMCSTPPSGSNGTVSCSAASLAPGSYTFTLVVDVGTYTRDDLFNTATAAATSSDPNGANNASTNRVPGPKVPIPALSQPMLVLLAALLGLGALAFHRRRQRALRGALPDRDGRA